MTWWRRGVAFAFGRLVDERRKMRTCATRVAGWLCVLLAAVSADSGDPVYKKVGDDVVLKADTASASGGITSILWRDGPNLAVQWDGGEVTAFRHFSDRGRLNMSSGELTITGLTREDSGMYTPEINNKEGAPVHLIVISPVPAPAVSTSCDGEGTSCVLTCQGDATDAGPVSFKWRSGDAALEGSSAELRITKEDSSNRTEFSCELQNPVSQESSRPVPNPLIKKTTDGPGSPEPEGDPKIRAGLTVFISLLVAVMLLVGFHRWKAGAWFYQKDSMPWEADFWGKTPRDAAVSNGTAARRGKGQTEEETAMT